MAAKALPAGTTRKTSKGYIYLKVVDDPYYGTGWVSRSRWVVSHNLKQQLESSFDVHHINGNKSDDSLENLEVLPHGEHSAHHRVIGTPWNKGKKGCYNKERIEKFRLQNRNRKWSEESKQKMRTFAKQRKDLVRNSLGQYEKMEMVE